MIFKNELIYMLQSVQKNTKELNSYDLEFKYLKQFFLSIFFIFLLAQPCSAHSPEGFFAAGLSTILIAAGIAGAVKFYLIEKLRGFKPKSGTLSIIVVIELIVMIFSLLFMVSKYPESGTIVQLLGGSVIYYIVAVFLNLFLLKEINQKLRDVIVVRNITLSALLGLFFPAFLILLALIIFVPLYILFGG